MDTVPFWGAGLELLSGHWQSLWYHGLETPEAFAFTGLHPKYGKPPDNQAWGDYMGVKILSAGHRRDRRHRQHGQLVEYLESGEEFDILKGRPGKFRELGPPAPAGDVRSEG